jgi:hypothetical protein
MRSVLLYRATLTPKEEIAAAQSAGFFCTSSRMQIKTDDIVIGRFSVLPFYREQETDILSVGAHLVNSLLEHDYVADLRNYVADLKELTPKTWFRLEDVPKDGGPFVLKGATNSKKSAWKTHMYAANFSEAVKVHSRLMEDGLIGDQNIYVRQYVPLFKLGEILNGMPLTEEYRIFVYCGKILSSGFYWDAYHDDVIEQYGSIPRLEDADIRMEQLLHAAIKRIGDHVPFYAIDIAHKADGGWMIVELNDGQMSGLSANKPDMLYQNLFKVMNSY